LTKLETVRYLPAALGDVGEERHSCAVELNADERDVELR